MINNALTKLNSTRLFHIRTGAFFEKKEVGHVRSLQL